MHVERYDVGVTNTPAQAIAFAQARVAASTVVGVGDCLGSLRDDYWGPGQHAFGGTAWDAYLATKVRGQGAAPPGALHFWKGGSTGAGHITLGLDATNCISTDFGPSGYIGDGRERVVSITSIAQNDPLLTYVGWTRDLDGEVVVPEVIYMILVQKKDGGPTYHYTGSHIDPLTDHQVLRAVGLGAVKRVLNDTDEIFSLGPTPSGTTGAHTHSFITPVSATVSGKTSQPQV